MLTPESLKVTHNAFVIDGYVGYFTSYSKLFICLLSLTYSGTCFIEWLFPLVLHDKLDRDLCGYVTEDSVGTEST